MKAFHRTKLPMTFVHRTPPDTLHNFPPSLPSQYKTTTVQHFLSALCTSDQTMLYRTIAKKVPHENGQFIVTSN